MNTEQKKKIKQLFEKKRSDLGYSQKQAAIAAGSKASTVSQVFSGKYPADDTGIYRVLAHWVGFSSESWKTVKDSQFKYLNTLLTDAHKYANCYGIAGKAGIGKSETLEWYALNHKNVIYVECDIDITKKILLKQIIRQLGGECHSLQIYDMIEFITQRFLQLNKPMLLIDEFDKLPNKVKMLTISLFNRLENHCAIIICGSKALKKQMERNVVLNKVGFDEMASRFALKTNDPSVLRFKEPPQLSENDVTMICEGNGITDTDEIQEVIDDCAGDKRRIKRKIHALKKLKTLAA
jgi:Cdc6-like AAA superfamily ATPase